MIRVQLIKVDVIMAVFNAEATVEDSVRSAMHQVMPPNKSPASGMLDFDICVCCYNDASTDGSLELLKRLEKEFHSVEESASTGVLQTRLLIGSAQGGSLSRGAGYARNQAAKLRDEHETRPRSNSGTMHFICVLDSDDLMHETRIAEQTLAMLSMEGDQNKTLVGSQFERLPADSTEHYTRWANSLSDERLRLEQFRECTLLQPTWFMARAWFEQLGGYVEAPPITLDKSEQSLKRTKTQLEAEDKVYKLIHPSELPALSAAANEGSRKRKRSTMKEASIDTIRLAEDTRFFYAHILNGGGMHLHRTATPLVTYRHRVGMSQSSSTPRRLLLKLRTKAWEDIVFNREDAWRAGFAIWGGGRDGKDFLKALSPSAAAKVVCFVDVDEKKIEQIKYYDNPDFGRRIPILHFTQLAKNLGVSSFGKIEKTCNKDTFNLTRPAVGENETRPSETRPSDIEPEVLHGLPVVVCVAMYRTNGALERNVASIGRVEGQNLWHIC